MSAAGPSTRGAAVCDSGGRPSGCRRRVDTRAPGHVSFAPRTMADDKKPKIDLKSRLQQMGGPGAAAPPPAAMPAPLERAAAPAKRAGADATVPPPSVPPPSGIPRPMMAPRAAPPRSTRTTRWPRSLSRSSSQAAAHAAIAQPQRIEVDEGAVQVGAQRRAQAEAGRRAPPRGRRRRHRVGRRRRLAAGGRSREEHARRARARGRSAQGQDDRRSDEGQASPTAARASSATASSRPTWRRTCRACTSTSRATSSSAAASPASRRTRRRASSTSSTASQALNDKKDLIVALLNELQKPITDELARPAGQMPLTLVAIVDKSAGGPRDAPRSARHAHRARRQERRARQADVHEPARAATPTLPRLTGEKIPKDGAVIPVVPTSFDKVCPSPVKGQITQLMSSMNSLIDDIQGQKGDDSIGLDAKPGLSDLAGRLADSLNKVN